MRNLSVSKRFGWSGNISEKSNAVMRMFGLTVDSLKEKAITHSCQIEIDDGDVVYITGPSGSGKSVLLKEIEKKIPEDQKVNLEKIELDDERLVIDCIQGDLLEGLKVLNTAGLNDCLCVLNRPGYLSDGQKYRFRLAKAIASGKKYIFADEFCSGLDGITAAVVSYNVQRFAKQKGVIFILAGSSENILADLCPDVLVFKELCGAVEVVYKRC